MKKIQRLAACVAALCMGAGTASQAHDEGRERDTRHVLLISIDGMHALDLHNCIETGLCPNLAALTRRGVNYTRSSTSMPSDSFPGLSAMISGGSPKFIGVYYDVAYDRVFAPPAEDTGNGVLHGHCVPDVANGTRTEYEEGINVDQTKINGGGPYSALDGGYKSINPKRLPRDPFAGCEPVYPWNFVRGNTIFGVLHHAGGYTAWSDKHPAYASVSGPTGTSEPSNLDDFYGPEINSNVIALPGIKTASGIDCSHIDRNTTSDWTTDFDATKCYDQLKVNAVLNWIQGKSHLGDRETRVPVVYGMNFQAVSVGQKLIEKGVKGGYTDAQGTMSAALRADIRFVDGALGQFVNELVRAHHLDDTTIIVTAKHGQSPIDPTHFFPIPGSAGTNGTPPSAILGASFLPDSELNQIGATEDDISLLWLKPGASTAAAVELLQAHAKDIGGGEIFYGESLEPLFGKPGLPVHGGDPRTPDIIVAPNVGVVYTGSTKKQSEHGGFAHDDTNVMLLVSSTTLRPRTVESFVETSQVAPTILKLLGHSPAELDAVRAEGTPVLPGLSFED